jgi:hypothetical protein
MLGARFQCVANITVVIMVVPCIGRRYSVSSSAPSSRNRFSISSIFRYSGLVLTRSTQIER